MTLFLTRSARTVRRGVVACAAALALHAGALAAPPAAWPAGTFRVLCYHDIRDNLRASFDTAPEGTAVGTDALVTQFEWLRANGYNVVGLDQILEARRGGRALPDKAVLLTFDDGYASFYERVYPLLRTYGYHAVLAVVTAWMRPDANGQVVYDDHAVDASRFVTWAQLREMVDSGLVEVASHSDDLHHGVVANPQGNTMPAAVSLRYADDVGYEGFDTYRERVRDDLERSATSIERGLGRRPRAIVWPYGAYNRFATDAARTVGFEVGFNLQSIFDRIDDSPMTWGRELLAYNTDIGAFESMLTARPGAELPDPELRIRAMHVDLDYVYDPDPQVQERNLGALVERVRAMGASHVFLQAFADPDGDGVADALYFPNRHMPMRADLFARAAWQLRTRAGVRVFAWMPTLAFALPQAHPSATLRVAALAHAEPSNALTRYARLSPFSASARTVIRELYEDLGQHAGGIQGVLFHDDATLDDFEDASTDALDALRAAGLPPDVRQLRRDPALAARWTRFKTEALTGFTLELADTLRDYVPGLLTARNLYASVALDAESRAWFAQDVDDMLAHYDFTAVMAMPYMEQARKPTAWLADLADTILARPGAADRTVFELQAFDWRNHRHVPAKTVASHTTLLREHGAHHIAYYPDDFLRGAPDLEVLRPAFSLTRFPASR